MSTGQCWELMPEQILLMTTGGVALLVSFHRFRGIAKNKHCFLRRGCSSMHLEDDEGCTLCHAPAHHHHRAQLPDDEVLLSTGLRGPVAGFTGFTGALSLLPAEAGSLTPVAALTSRASRVLGILLQVLLRYHHHHHYRYY